MVKCADNIFHTTAMSKKRMSGRRYDKCLDLGEFDTFKRLLKWGRNIVIFPTPYL